MGNLTGRRKGGRRKKFQGKQTQPDCFPPQGSVISRPKQCASIKNGAAGAKKEPRKLDFPPHIFPLARSLAFQIDTGVIVFGFQRAEDDGESGNAIENLGETKIRPPASLRKCKYFQARNTTEETICQILCKAQIFPKCHFSVKTQLIKII